MAKRIEEMAENTGHRIITQQAFRKLIKDVTKGDERISDAKSEVNSVIERAIADHRLHKDALRVVRKYLKKDPVAAAEFIAHLDAYWEFAGLSLPAEDLVEPSRKPERPENVHEFDPTKDTEAA